MIEYLLRGSVPAKKNAKVFNTKTHRMFPSKRYQEWHEYAALTLKPMIKKCLEDKCYVVLVFCNDSQRRKDSDNSVSSIFDALVDFNAIKDDCWQLIPHHHVFNTYDKGNAWCKISIYNPEEKERYKSDLIKLIDLY